jgi:hypothetical protein
MSADYRSSFLALSFHNISPQSQLDYTAHLFHKVDVFRIE